VLRTVIGNTVFDRDQALRRLASEDFDVLVVGGGITGTGVALDAASRGMRTALVERLDFASGTSSRSSKLVHGGLRYLQQREFRLVYEALAERQVLRNTAPHLVRLLPFLIPLFGRGGAINPKLARAVNWALWLYDLTGGARIGKLHERISADEALAHMPTLDPAKVLGAFVYYDAQTDDARLTLTVARSAADHGAVIANYCDVIGLARDASGTVCGATVSADGDTFDIRARVVVNATGVWADDVRALDEGANPDSLRPAKGIHITVPWDRIRNDLAATLPVSKDRRSIFVVPQGDRAYIGTTDTDYEGPLEDPQCTAEDVDYLLRGVNSWIREPLTVDDVVGTWAGLRPLVKGESNVRTADLSRRHQVLRSTGGLVTVTGGKLTTYRRMAADTVDAVGSVLGIKRRSRTRKLLLHGAQGVAELGADGAAERMGIRPDLLRHLVSRYGTDARAVAAMIAGDSSLGEVLVPGLPYVRAEAIYAARYEMAQTLGDILTRRLPARWFAAEASAAVADAVARSVAADLGWDDARVSTEVASYRDTVRDDREKAGLPVAVIAAPGS